MDINIANKKKKTCVVCGRRIKSGYKYCYKHRVTKKTDIKDMPSDLPLMGYVIATFGALGIIAFIFYIGYLWVMENLNLIMWSAIIILPFLSICYLLGNMRNKRIKIEEELILEKKNKEDIIIEKEEEAEREKYMEKTINKVVEKIKQFESFKKYNKESQYQMQLGGYLQMQFKKVKIEVQKDGSRPDIIINDNIAIEIKGPTTMSELKTLPDKCMRYPKNYEEVAIVLFDIQLSNEKLELYLNSLKDIFPKIIIIKK